jgi:hypothetical protein
LIARSQTQNYHSKEDPSGAGKSVIIADLLAQIGHRFGFRLIVEEGLSQNAFISMGGAVVHHATIPEMSTSPI